MRRLRLLSAMVTLLILAACSSTEKSLTAPAEEQPVVPAAGSSTIPTEPLAALAPGVLQPVRFHAGAVISQEGVYFLDVTTGQGEGWISAGEPRAMGTSMSDDNRFVILQSREDGYLVDRNGDHVWRWDPQRVRLILADAQGFLFAEVGTEEMHGILLGTGRLFWTGPDMKARQVFDLGEGALWYSSALLSPDGGQLAVLYRKTVVSPSDVSLFDLKSGVGRRLDTPLGDIATDSLKNHGQLLQRNLVIRSVAADPPTWTHKIVRYTWQGELSEEIELPGEHPFFSPDGRWVSWVEWPVGDLAPVTVVAEASSLKPHLQAPGTTTCFQAVGGSGNRWLADSSGLVVSTAGGYRLLTLEGDLHEPPAFAGLDWKTEPQPAPDHPDRFALGRLEVSNGVGTGRQGVTLNGFVTPYATPPWGVNSLELRFVLPPPGKGGACKELPPVEARVILPAQPFPK